MKALACVAAACLWAGSASAAAYAFSYASVSGGTLEGLFEGELQADGDTVIVSAVSDLAFDGSPGPALTFVTSLSDFGRDTGFPPTVTLCGAEMDLLACTAAGCPAGADGLILTFAGLIGGGGGGLFTTSGFGGLDENFDPDRYSLAAVDAAVIPLPAPAALLAGALGLLALRRRGAARPRR